MTRRPPFFVCLALVAGLGGCTFLVHFVDAPASDCDGGACDAGRMDASDDTDPARDAAADTFDAGPAHCGPYKPDGSSTPCSVNVGFGPGFYCACHGLNNYAGSPLNLVECRTDGTLAAETACPNGCANFPQSYRDQCDNCAGKSGKFCASQLGYVGALPKIVVICDRGRAFSVDLCPTGTNCAGAPGVAVCN